MNHTITRPCIFEGEPSDYEIELTIKWEIHGKYISATHLNPPEYPEIEITSAIDEHGNSWLTKLTPEEEEDIIEKIESL